MDNRTSCDGPLVVPIYAFDEFDNTTILVECISARVHFGTIYDIVQFGGAVLFSFGILVGIVYLFLAQKRIRDWNTLKEINLQLLIGATFHVIWLSVDILSFRHILPVFVERFFRDFPCSIILTATFHFLTIWYNANAAANLKGGKSKLFNRTNGYIFQILFVSLALSNRITQQVYNDPSLFSLFESIFMILLSSAALFFFVISSILLYQVRKIAITTQASPVELGSKISNFYGMMKKFYLFFAPLSMFLSFFGIVLVATHVLYLPVVIAAEHLWTVAIHLCCWGALNYVLWKFSFPKKKKSSSTKDNSSGNMDTSSAVKSSENENFNESRDITTQQ